jgi:hypothetical protein
MPSVYRFWRKGEDGYNQKDDRDVEDGEDQKRLPQQKGLENIGPKAFLNEVPETNNDALHLFL